MSACVGACAAAHIEARTTPNTQLRKARSHMTLPYRDSNLNFH